MQIVSVSINSTTVKANQKPNSVKVEASATPNTYTKSNVVSNLLGFFFANKFSKFLIVFLLIMCF